MHGDLYLKQPVIGTLRDVVITYGTLKRRLDVTPVAADNGAPEFNDDLTVASLYIGLFNMLKNRSVPV